MIRLDNFSYRYDGNDRSDANLPGAASRPKVDDF